MRENKLDVELRQLSAELELKRPVYERAMERVSGMDEDWNRDYERKLDEVFSLIMKYQIGDDGQKAIGLLSAAKILARGLQAPLEIVRDYERLKALQSRKIAEREAMEQAAASSRRARQRDVREAE